MFRFKKIFFIISLFIFVFTVSACGTETESTTETGSDESKLTASVDGLTTKVGDLEADIDGLNAQIGELQNEEVEIVLLHTNDMHGRVREGKYDGMGLAKLSGIVTEYERQFPNTFLIDVGDAFHGTTFATLEDGASYVEVMNAVGYDVLTPGNHDFNYGYDRLKELADMADFPIISANAYEKGEDLDSEDDDFLAFNPYIIRNFDGVKVGFFGLSTPETAYKTHPDNVANIDFKDTVEAARRMVTELQDQVDVIVGVAHVGLDESSVVTSKMIAEQVDGIDVFLDGHSHTELENGLVINETLIASVGDYNKNLGVVKLVVKNGEVTTKNASFVTKEESNRYGANYEVIQIIERIEAEQAEILSEVVGTTDVMLDGERAHVRTGETNLGNLITDVMVDLTGADLAITNGGGIRSSIDAGEVTKGEVIEVLPFGNYIVTKEITGAQIKAILEHATSGYPEAAGTFSHVSGITFQIDMSKPVGDRIVNIKVGTEDLDLTASYVVATNDFLAAGGDDYPEFKDADTVNEYMGLDEAVIDYFKALTENGETANPTVEGRITAINE